MHFDTFHTKKWFSDRVFWHIRNGGSCHPRARPTLFIWKMGGEEGGGRREREGGSPEPWLCGKEDEISGRWMDALPNPKESLAPTTTTQRQSVTRPRTEKVDFSLIYIT